MTPRHIAARIAGPAVILAALVVPAIVAAPRMPDPSAIHWNLHGQPDGSGAWWVGPLLTGVIWALAWAVIVFARVPAPRWTTSWLYGIGGILVLTQTTTVWANDGAASWHDAAELPAAPIVLAATAAAAVIAGAIGWALAGPDPVRAPDWPARPLPTVGLGATETAIWGGTAHNRGMLAVAAAALIAAIVAPLAVTPALVLIALVFVAFAHVTVIVNETAVSIRFGVAQWPRRTIPLGDIATAEAIDVEPLKYGGWGWRVRPDRSSYIVRRGEGVQLCLRDDRIVIVTVSDAEHAAGLVNDYLARENATR